MKESLPYSPAPSRALPSRGLQGGTVAPAGHIVPPERGGRFFALGPLTSRPSLWHNVPRRPLRLLLGFVAHRFSLPEAADFFHHPFLPFYRFAVLRPPYAAARIGFPFCGFFTQGIFIYPVKTAKRGIPTAAGTGRRTVLPFCGARPQIGKTTDFYLNPHFPRFAGRPQNSARSFCGPPRKSAKR